MQGAGKNHTYDIAAAEARLKKLSSDKKEETFGMVALAIVAIMFLIFVLIVIMRLRDPFNQGKDEVETASAALE